MTAETELQRRIRLQLEVTRADAHIRAAATLMLIAMSAYFLDRPVLGGIVAATMLFEGLAMPLYGRIVEGTRLQHALFIAVTLGASSSFAALPLALFVTGNPTAGLIGFFALTAALIYALVLRTTWIAFGAATVVPMFLSLVVMVTLYLVSVASIIEAAIATIVIVTTLGYTTLATRDLIKTRNDLMKARQEAEQASIAKSRFLAAMSHEIRTPLNALCGMSELIDEDARDAASASTRERTQIMRTAADTLKSIVDEILDHASITAGATRLRCAPADLGREVRNTVAMFEPPAKAKGLELTCDPSDDLPTWASFDAQRVRQILSNLLSNAVKYTDRGRIGVSVLGRPVSGGWKIEIAVSDTGRGLTAEEAGALFQEFVRNERDAVKGPGTGLGLVISREFARMMDGDLAVRSRPGEGSVFTACFRVDSVRALPKDLDRERTSQALVAGEWPALRRILLVDDNHANRLVARAFLKSSGAEILEAEDGEAALETLKRFYCDLVLLDMHMPRMDGAATFEAMRKFGGRLAKIPVITLTADAAARDRVRYLAIGMDGYVSKPITKAALHAEIDRVMRARSPATTTECVHEVL